MAGHIRHGDAKHRVSDMASRTIHRKLISEVQPKVEVGVRQLIIVELESS